MIIEYLSKKTGLGYDMALSRLFRDGGENGFLREWLRSSKIGGAREETCVNTEDRNYLWRNIISGTVIELRKKLLDKM